jgi:hypothetical protein
MKQARQQRSNHCHRAHPKVATPSTTREGGQTVAVVATPLSTLPPPSTDKEDRLYHQLADIHTTTTTQLAECTR